MPDRKVFAAGVIAGLVGSAALWLSRPRPKTFVPALPVCVEVPLPTETRELRESLMELFEEVRGLRVQMRLVNETHARRCQSYEDEIEDLKAGRSNGSCTPDIVSDDDDDNYLHVHCFGSERLLSGVVGETQMAHLPYDRAVGTVGSSMLISAALETMVEKSLSCLRVTGSDGRFVGVLTVNDAVVFLLHAEFAVVGQPVRDALRTCGSVSPTTTLRQVVGYFKSGYDYISLRGDDERLVSQASVLRFINQHLAEITEDRTALAGVTAACMMVPGMSRPANQKLRHALQYMLGCAYRSVALLDEDGTTVVAVLSLSDVKRAVRLVTPSEHLDMTSLDFLTLSRSGGRPVGEVVCVTSNSSAVDLLSRMVREEVHSVVVCGLNRSFEGTVTTGSLLVAMTR
jgi:CBS domain-containing protein